MSSVTSTCKASCLVMSQLSASNQVLGTLSIVQLPNNTVRITGTLHHLQPKTIHGISVCQAGDLSNGAASCGPIFNPFGTFTFPLIARCDIMSSLILCCFVCIFGCILSHKIKVNHTEHPRTNNVWWVI